jgi:hypothetical protein
MTLIKKLIGIITFAGGIDLTVFGLTGQLGYWSSFVGGMLLGFSYLWLWNESKEAK